MKPKMSTLRWTKLTIKLLIYKTLSQQNRMILLTTQ